MTTQTVKIKMNNYDIEREVMFLIDLGRSEPIVGWCLAEDWHEAKVEESTPPPPTSYIERMAQHYQSAPIPVEPVSAPAGTSEQDDHPPF